MEERRRTSLRGADWLDLRDGRNVDPEDVEFFRLLALIRIGPASVVRGQLHERGVLAPTADPLLDALWLGAAGSLDSSRLSECGQALADLSARQPGLAFPLALLGSLQAQAGDLDGASHILSRLKVSAPDDPHVLQLERAVTGATGNASDLFAVIDRSRALGYPSGIVERRAERMAARSQKDRQRAWTAYVEQERLLGVRPTRLRFAAWYRSRQLQVAAQITAYATFFVAPVLMFGLTWALQAARLWGALSWASMEIITPRRVIRDSFIPLTISLIGLIVWLVR